MKNEQSLRKVHKKTRVEQAFYNFEALSKLLRTGNVYNQQHQPGYSIL